MKKEIPMYGWCMPIGTKKYHIFREGKALCGKWIFFGMTDPVVGDKLDSPLKEDCSVCRKKMEKILGK